MGGTVYDVITERMLDALEAGRVPWQKPWDASADWPRNLASGKNYRGVNVWMLLAQGYGDPRWLTFKQASERKARIRKGEHGTPVVFWKRDQIEDTDEETGERKMRRRFILRYYLVWNVAQIEGLEVAPIERKARANDPIEAAEAIVNGMPDQPPILWGQRDQAYYSPARDEVHLPPREQFASPESVYGTLFHELGHSTGHASRLDRGLTSLDHFGSDRYGREELVAEMTAAFLAAEAGIERILDNSAAYIAGWVGKIKTDRRAVVIAAAQAHKAAEFILNRQAAEAEPVAERELVAA